MSRHRWSWYGSLVGTATVLMVALGSRAASGNTPCRALCRHPIAACVHHATIAAGCPRLRGGARRVCRRHVRAERQRCRQHILAACEASPRAPATCSEGGAFTEACQLLPAAPTGLRGSQPGDVGSAHLTIVGHGFFVLRVSESPLFAPATDTQLRADGTLTNALGLPLQGYPVNATGDETGGLQDVDVARAASAPQATTRIALQGNLAGDAPSLPVFDPTSYPAAMATANFILTLDIYDALGAAHTLSVFFTKLQPGQWTVYLGVDDGDLGGTAGSLHIVGHANLDFGLDGQLLAAPALALSFPAVEPVHASVDLSGMTQFVAPSGIQLASQDGFPARPLAGITVDGRGFVWLDSGRGALRPAYVLAVARFGAPAGLKVCGEASLFAETPRSGPPSIDVAEVEGCLVLSD